MPQWSQILIQKNPLPLQSSLNRPSYTQLPHRHLPPITLLLPADLPYVLAFLVFNLLATSPSECLSPSILHKICSVPFLAQHTCAVWDQVLPEFLPHRKYLYLLSCLILAHAASYMSIASLVVFRAQIYAECCSVWMFLAPVWNKLPITWFHLCIAI